MILDASDVAAAEATIRDISTDLLALDPSTLPGPKLSDGHAGLALVHFFLDRQLPGVGHRARCEEALALAAEGVSSLRPFGLFHGFCGVGWVVDFVVKAFEGPDADDYNEAIDEALLQILAREPTRQEYELRTGLLGIGVYALERLPRRSARRILQLLTEALALKAEEQDGGLTWKATLDNAFMKMPVWNLGVLHGVSGAIAVLSGIVTVFERSSDAGDRATAAQARRLVEGAVRWVCAHELPMSEPARFRFGVGQDGFSSQLARLGWCYGEAGLAPVLLRAGRMLGHPSWESDAIRFGLAAVNRDEQTALVDDAALCHGAAGLGHIFHRLYAMTHDERFAAASRRWFARALSMRQAGHALGGYSAHVWDPNQASRTRVWKDNFNLLEGVGGIALAYCAALGDGNAGWDRLFLLSVSGQSDELA
jgi:lantibiotic biosynthesis protein